MEAPSFAALIFDCDGVLVNSEELAQRAERQALADVGMHYAAEEFTLRFSGTSTPDFNAALRRDYRERFQRDLPADFFKSLSVAVGQAYESSLAVIPGADVLARTWSGPKAVASSSSYDLVQFKLAKVGMHDVFGESIFTADNIRAKPHPDLFLTSAEHLRTAPANCVVVEDSVNGVIAAKRAGMQVIGFVGGGHCLPQHADLLTHNGADVVFEDFTAISEFVFKRGPAQ